MKPVLKTACLFLSMIIFSQTALAASSLRVYRVEDGLSEPGLQYTTCYPRITGIKDAEAQNRVNIRLKETAETSAQAARLAARQLTGTGAAVLGSFDYEVKRNENGLLSLLMKDSCQVNGNKGMTRATAMTIETVTGREMKLGDFFLSNVNYQAALDDAVRAQLKSRGLEKKLLQPFKTVGDSRQFYLTKDSLVLFFQQYEYFPYDNGMVEFTVPLSTLSGSLRPEFRL